MQITLEYLLTNKFNKTGLEVQEYKKENKSGMFSVGELDGLPAPDEEKRIQLRIKMSDLVAKRCKTFAEASIQTQINAETLRKYVSYNQKRKISRIMLAKFVLGLNLSQKDADELFRLQEHPLDPENVLLDAVVIHCLEEGGGIDGFYETCEQVGLEIDINRENV